MKLVYLDMDGVICNFSKAYEEIITPFGFNMTDNRPNNKLFCHIVKHTNIFENLEPMPDAHILIDYLSKLEQDYMIKVEILTSVGSTDKDHFPIASSQKHTYLWSKRIIWKPNFVTGKKEKAKYAKQNTILIDDSVGCVEPFIEAGGNAILHTNALKTIKELNDILGIKEND